MSHLLATSSAPKLCHNCGCPHGRTIRRSFSHYDGRLWQQKPPTGIAYGVLTAINTADNSMLCDLQQLQRRLRRRLLVRSARINCAMKYDNCNRLRCVALCCVVLRSDERLSYISWLACCARFLQGDLHKSKNSCRLTSSH